MNVLVMQLSSKLDHSNILNHMDEIIKKQRKMSGLKQDLFIFGLPHSLNLDFQCQPPTNVHTSRTKMSITSVCSFLNLYVFIWLHQVLVAACRIFRTRCGIQFSDREPNPGSLYWEHRLLATGPPGKSLSPYVLW